VSGPRRAALDASASAGNNAHLIVEEPPAGGPEARLRAVRSPHFFRAIAVIALGARVGSGSEHGRLARSLFEGGAEPSAARARRAEIRLPRSGLRFPPRDLQQTLPQQLLLLAAALEAVHGISLPNERTATYVGMQCDAEIARHGARWRVAGWAETLGAPPAGRLRPATASCRCSERRASSARCRTSSPTV
jgi:hypothetical protein